MELNLELWLQVLAREYLQGYIPAGGSAVKFAVTPEPRVSREIGHRLAELAEEGNMQFAVVDSADTKLHLIDRLFFRVAEQIDWDTLTRYVVTSLLQADGFAVPGDAARLTFDDVATLNNYDQALLRGRTRELLYKHVFNDYAMAQEFRIAMLQLCQAQLEGGEEGQAVAELIKSWLRGTLRLISTLKRYQIFQKIARHNARHLFLSLAHWLRLGGSSGLVVVMDVSRYTTSRRPAEPDGSLYHTTAAAMDAYEVLRQFIDETDDLESCLIVVTAQRDILTDEKRGLARYDALKLRVWDEVHDRGRVNPLASLVRIEGDQPARIEDHQPASADPSSVSEHERSTGDQGWGQ